MTNQKIVNELIDMEAMAPILLLRATRLRFQLQKGLKPKKSLKEGKYKALTQQFSLNFLKPFAGIKLLNHLSRLNRVRSKFLLVPAPRFFRN